VSAAGAGQVTTGESVTSLGNRVRAAGIRDTSAQDIPLDTGAAAAGRRLRRLVLAVVLLLAAAGTAWLAAPILRGYLGSSSAVAADRLRTATVERGRFVRDVAAEGVVVAAVSPTLYAGEDGTVRFLVQAGDVVRAGAELAVIDSPELTSRLAQERATLQSLYTGLRRRELDNRARDLTNQQSVDLARVSVDAAERELRRAEASRQAEVISMQDYEKAVDDLERARLEFRHAQQNAALQRESNAFDLETLAIERNRQALVVEELERRVQDLTIRAPVDGMVGTLAVEQRAAVTRNAAVVTVVDLSALEVQIRVPESYGDDLAIGLPAEVSFNGKAYPATLTAVSPEVTENQVLGRIRFDGELPPRLRQNQRVAARVLLQASEDALKVARGPFLDVGGGRIAYVLDDRTVRRRFIQTGATNLREVEVLDGLREGDVVVISDISVFKGADSVMLAR
jgi:HlyD family secretion protein